VTKGLQLKDGPRQKTIIAGKEGDGDQTVGYKAVIKGVLAAETGGGGLIGGNTSVETGVGKILKIFL